MKNNPVEIKLLGKENSNYRIEFPYLNVPVIVNEYFYKKMRNSDDYKFII